MKRLRLLTFLSIATIAVSAAHAETARYLISLKHGTTERRVETLRNARPLRTLDLVAADLTPDDVTALRNSPNVRYVSRVVPRNLEATSPMPPLAANAAPYQAEQTIPWGIQHVHAPDVWPYSRGTNVNVAVLDTGIDRNHPDVGPNVYGTYDTFAKTDTAVDDNGHGTHVSGTIAALNNSIGVVGVAPEAHLWAVKVLDASGNGSDETVVAGLDKVLQWKQANGGNWIVSLSLGSADPSVPEEEAFQRAKDAGILAVAAAGNRGTPQLDYPGAYPTVLAVGASTQTDDVANFSSFGANMGVVAPGTKVLSSVPLGMSTEPATRADGGDWILGFPFTGSAKGEIHATLVDCGFGSPSEIPPQVKGNIAIMKRGNNLYFAEKVLNAMSAGALAAIIYNNDASDPVKWSLFRLDCTDPVNCVPWSEDVNRAWPVVIGLRQDDGLALLKQAGRQVTVGMWPDDYEFLNGTSMATPHVSGIAALLWALAPSANADDVRSAILGSAHDLGNRGYDVLFGYGLVDAYAAAKLISPNLTPAPITPAPPKHRPAPH